MKPPRSLQTPLFVEFLIGVAMVTAFCACLFAFQISSIEIDPAVPQPASISQLRGNIVSVNRADDGDTLEIVLDQAPTYMANILADLGKSALVITRGMQRDFPVPHIQTVRFTIRREGKGIERILLEDRTISVDFRRSKLMERPLGQTDSFQQLLNATDRVVYYSANDRVIVEAFCHDEVAKSAKIFCDRELQRKLK